MARSLFNQIITATVASNLQPLSNVRITVKLAGTSTAANIYTTRTGGTQGPASFANAATTGNPFNTGASGVAAFWAENDEYDIDILDLNNPARINPTTVGFSSVPGIDQGVLGSKIANSSLSGAKLIDNTIPAGKLADGSVTAAKLVPGTVSVTQLAKPSVGTAELGNDSVTTLKLIDKSVTSQKLALPISCRLFRGTTAALGNGALTYAFFTNQRWNNGPVWAGPNSGLMTAPLAGTYSVGAAGAFGGVGNFRVDLRLQHLSTGGADLGWIAIQGANLIATGGTLVSFDDIFLNPTALVQLNAGESVAVQAFASFFGSGASCTWSASSSTVKYACDAWMKYEGPNT